MCDPAIGVLSIAEGVIDGLARLCVVVAVRQGSMLLQTVPVMRVIELELT